MATNSVDGVLQNGDSGIDMDAISKLEEEKAYLASKDCKVPNVIRLINEEINRLQGKQKGPPKYVEVVSDRPTKVSVKVLVPTKEHPKFNFVGKLLGPMGNTMKRLQEETATRMAVLGRGSVRNREKEEELRTGSDPKYSHLNDDLHVDISAIAPAAEAYARLSYALVEIRKYLIPDSNDEIAHEQMREMQMIGGSSGGGGSGNVESSPRGRGRGIALAPRGSRAMPPPRRPPPLPKHSRVLSILDKARQSLEGTQTTYTAAPPVYGGYESYSGFAQEEYTANPTGVGIKTSLLDRGRFRTNPY